MATNRELTEAYNRLSGRLIEQAAAFAINSFTNLGSWRDEDVIRYDRAVKNVLGGLKRQASNLATGFHRTIAQNSGELFSAPTITANALTTEALRNGVAAETVWRRPFVDLWTALDNGKTMTEAIQAGAFRARSLATTEVQLARRNASLASRSRNDNIVGYVRTLTGRENCALCYVASTQRYTRGQLMPIHPGCDCGELPIYGKQDPGQIIDQQLLDATHEAIRARFGKLDFSARDLGAGKFVSYEDGDRLADFTGVTIRDNGELGPVLTVTGQNFTGPNDF